MEPSTEILLGKEGPLLPLGKPQCGKWLCHGKEERRWPPSENASLTSAFQGLVLLHLHPSTGWNRSCCFPLIDPHDHHTLKLLGVCFQSQLGCSTIGKAAMYNWKSRKRGWKRKEKKISPWLKTWREVAPRDSLVGFFTNITLAKKVYAILLPVRIFS